jgi:hypothetical protein
MSTPESIKKGISDSFDKEMRDGALGPLSSHPYWMKWRTRLLYPIGLGVAGYLTCKVVPMLAFYQAKQFVYGFLPVGLLDSLLNSSTAVPDSLRDIGRTLLAKPEQTWSDPRFATWIGLAFAAGAVIAIGLCDRFASRRAARLKVALVQPEQGGASSKDVVEGLESGGSVLGVAQHLLAKEVGSRLEEAAAAPFKDDLTIPTIVAFAVVTVVVVIPAAAYVLHLLPPLWESALDTMLISGLWILLAKAGLSNDSGQPRRWWGIPLSMLFFAVPVYNSVIGFFTTGLGSLIFPTPISLHPVTISGHMTTALWILGAVTAVGWFCFPKRPKKQKDDEEKDVETIDHAALVDEILSELRTPYRLVKPLSTLEAGPVSELSAAPSFWPIFTGGLTPTADEMSFLEKFRAGTLELFVRAQSDPTKSDWWNGFNLMLSGPSGSGKSTCLIAGALYASIVGGGRPLVIVPRADKKRWMCTRINRMLAEVRLDTHHECGQLDARSVGLWMEAAAPLPSIMVATPEDLEEVLFQVPRDGEGEELKMKVARYECLNESFTSVFVENLGDFDAISRSHLTFQLEKLRLHLASLGRAMVSVVATPLLDKSEVPALGARLFGETGFRPDRDSVILRIPPPGKECDAVEITSDKPAELAEEIARCLMKRELSMILLRKGIDEEACAEQQKKLSAEAGGGTLVVLGDLDQPPGEDDVESVIYQNLTTLDATLAVGLRFPGKSTLVFHIRPSESPLLIESGDGALPVMASGEASALAPIHAASLFGTLRESAVLEGEWIKRLLPRYAQAARGKPVGKPLAELRLEPSHDGNPGNDLLVLVRASASMAGIDTGNIPLNGLSVRIEASSIGSSLHFAEDEVGDLPRSTLARWISTSGQVMAQWSVEHAPLLLLRSEDGSFSAGSVKKDNQDIMVVARHYQGRGDDTTLPAVEISWEIPNQSVMDVRGGGKDYGLSWYETMSGEDMLAVRVMGVISGLISERGLFSGQADVPFAFTATVTPILLDPEDPATFAAGSLQTGVWDTRICGNGSSRRILALETHRISEFFCREFNGASSLAWPVVFESSGRRILWLIEPVGTGPSISRMLFQLLSATEFRQRFKDFLASDPSVQQMIPQAPRIGPSSLRQQAPEAEVPIHPQTSEATSPTSLENIIPAESSKHES